jgi:hypothetical protein
MHPSLYLLHLGFGEEMIVIVGWYTLDTPQIGLQVGLGDFGWFIVDFHFFY